MMNERWFDLLIEWQNGLPDLEAAHVDFRYYGNSYLLSYSNSLSLFINNTLLQLQLFIYKYTLTQWLSSPLEIFFPRKLSTLVILFRDRPSIQKRGCATDCGLKDKGI